VALRLPRIRRFVEPAALRWSLIVRAAELVFPLGTDFVEIVARDYLDRPFATYC
jgi:hypothetical protein